MKIISQIMGMKKRAHYNRLQKFKNSPLELQRQVLKGILRANGKTEIGQFYRFNTLKTIDAFRNAVPIRTANEYKPLLDKIYSGDHRSICHQKPLYFAMTAGSTGAFKHIPITRSLSNDINKGTLAYLHLFEEACPQIKDAPIQFMIGSGEGGNSPGNIPKGYVSGFHYKNLPAVIRNRFVVPYWVFTLADRTDRYYALVRYLAANKSLAAIVSMTPQNICNLAQVAMEQKHRLYQDIKSGSLTLNVSQQPDSEAADFLPEPDRAVRFFRAAEVGDSQAAMKELFPSLSCFSTWMGGNMSYATGRLGELFGPKDIFELPSSASEGIFLIPHKPNTAGGIAAIESHFFEYIPEQDYHRTNPDTLLVNQLEAGARYYLVVTTSGGLYRYNMEDLYEVTGFFGTTPILKFISKQARQVSITNERINESDVVEAMNQCKTCFSEPPDNFILMPNRNSHYDFVVDSEPGDMTEFALSFDNALRAVSKVYDIYRNDGQIGPVSIHAFPQTTDNPVKRYVEEIQFSSDLPSGQFKPLHVANSVELLERAFLGDQNHDSFRLTRLPVQPRQVNHHDQPRSCHAR